jgi:tripartite-type tricarboxylate transporter receptor subunit TctC
MYVLRLIKAIAAVALVAGAPSPASAQSDTWPSKPIKFIVPFAPGGGADVVARLVGAKLADALGQPVVVENRAGASGNIGAAVAARAPADGYTIAFAYSGTHAINPTLYPDPGFKNSDFAPVVLMMSVPQVMTLNAVGPREQCQGAHSRSPNPSPGQLNYASSAAFNQLAAALFNEMAGINVVHIPVYRRRGVDHRPTRGRCRLSVTDPPAVLPFMKAGRSARSP